eukprot:1625420-Amphidinium_carterae.1
MARIPCMFSCDLPVYLVPATGVAIATALEILAEKPDFEGVRRAVLLANPAYPKKTTTRVLPTFVCDLWWSSNIAKPPTP